MQTRNGYIEVKDVAQESEIIMQENSIVEVVSATEDSDVKTGDKVIFEGKKIEKRVNGEVKYFVHEDDVIAIL